MTPLISVIVPVYKVEKYLHRCVDSLINQTYPNCEIVLVDDGSPDNCPQICDDYASKNQNIKVVHKLNGGLSDARNVGVAESSGEYIAFVDSDDYVTENYVEYLYTLLEKNGADISIGGRYVIDEDGKVGTTSILNTPKQDICLNAYDAVKELCYGRLFGVCAWAKLYRRSLIESCKFPFGRLYEDLAIMPRLIGQSKLTIVGTEKIYFYQINDSSIMHHTVTDREYEDGLYACNQLMNYIDSNYPDLHRVAGCKFVRKQLDFMPVIARDKDYKYADKIAKFTRPYIRDIISDKDISFVFKVAALITSCGGVISIYSWRLLNMRRK